MKILKLLPVIALLFLPMTAVNAQSIVSQDNLKVNVNANSIPYSIEVVGGNLVGDYDNKDGLKYKNIVEEIIISDLSGTGDGWNLTVQSTPLKNESYTFPQGSLLFSINYPQELVKKVDIIHSNSVIIDDGAIKLIKAKEEKGLGVIKVPLKGEISIPKGKYEVNDGVYDTTLTWQLRSNKGEILFETEADYKLKIDSESLVKKDNIITKDKSEKPLPPTSTNNYNILAIGGVITGLGFSLILLLRKKEFDN